MERRVAVVTGANRGLGLATARALAQKSYTVILASRKIESCQKEAESLNKAGHDAHAMGLDMSRSESIEHFAQEFKSKFGAAAVLVNNAGIFIEENEAKDLATKQKKILDSLSTNSVGPFLLAQSLLPAMQERGFGRIVNVSSGMGQLSEMNGGYAAYRMSKSALNAVTKILAHDGLGKNILVNSVCPGWVKTDMGGSSATRTIEEGIFGIVWAATLPDGGPSGGFFRDGKAIAW